MSMPRDVHFEVPVDTSFFTPLQLQPTETMFHAWHRVRDGTMPPESWLLRETSETV
jgi:hypothetical protein